MEAIIMKKTAIYMLMLILVAVLLTSCAINTPTSPLSVTKAEETTNINIDNGNTEKILSLFNFISRFRCRG